MIERKHVRVLTIIGGAAVVVLLVLLTKWNLERAKPEMQFMIQCIEFHSAARCRSFWTYGRLDLGKHPNARP